MENMHILKIENDSKIIRNVVCSRSLQKASYSEVYDIIEHFDDELKKKIPLKFIAYIKNNRDMNYKVCIDYSKKISEQKLLNETKTLLSVIYRNFLCSKEEKEKLQLREKEELLKIEKQKEEKYDANLIFKKEKINKAIEFEPVSIIKVKKNLLSRIIDKIKKFFKKV